MDTLTHVASPDATSARVYPAGAFSDGRARRRGGQPLDPATRRKDRVIAATVHQLLHWGFGMRRSGDSPGVGEVIGLQAFLLRDGMDEPWRTSRFGGPLGEEQVERIYEAWLGPTAWQRKAREPRRLSQAWRKRWRPFGGRASLEAYAGCLLRNGGSLPRCQGNIVAWGQVLVLQTSREWFGPRCRIPMGDQTALSPEAARTVLGQGALFADGWKTRKT